MSEILNHIHQNPHPITEKLPQTDIFSVNRSEYLAGARRAKTVNGYDYFSDRQPTVDVLEPSVSGIKTVKLPMHNAIQLKLEAQKEFTPHRPK